jgi:hypothetical protein
LGNYQLQAEFPGAKTATAIPAEVQKLLGLPGKYNPYTGAYPIK